MYIYIYIHIFYIYIYIYIQIYTYIHTYKHIYIFTFDECCTDSQVRRTLPAAHPVDTRQCLQIQRP